ISLFAGNISSGIEPVFAYTYWRKVLRPDGTQSEAQVEDYAQRAFRERFGEATPLPDYFISAQTLSPDDHLAVQAAAQKYIDSSISKTINVPVDFDFNAFEDIYRKAYALGCKGCTTYRPSPVRGAVLEVRSEAVPAGVIPAQESPPLPAPIENPAEPALPLPLPPPKPRHEGGIVYMTQPLDRPE